MYTFEGRGTTARDPSPREERSGMRARTLLALTVIVISGLAAALIFPRPVVVTAAVSKSQVLLDQSNADPEILQ